MVWREAWLFQYILPITNLYSNVLFNSYASCSQFNILQNVKSTVMGGNRIQDSGWKEGVATETAKLVKSIILESLSHPKLNGEQGLRHTALQCELTYQQRMTQAGCPEGTVKQRPC